MRSFSGFWTITNYANANAIGLILCDTVIWAMFYPAWAAVTEYQKLGGL